MSYAAQAILRKVEYALSKDRELDPAPVIRQQLIKWRDALLTAPLDTGQVVLLSQTIAHLARLIAAEEALIPKESRR